VPEVVESDRGEARPFEQRPERAGWRHP
jgi:hypothetical protein